jgi:predicted amidohydrolase YtcJ
MLRIYEQLQRKMPRRDARHRLEHGTVINPSLVHHIRALGAISTPFSTYVYYHCEKMFNTDPNASTGCSGIRLSARAFRTHDGAAIRGR